MWGMGVSIFTMDATPWVSMDPQCSEEVFNELGRDESIVILDTPLVSNCLVLDMQIMMVCVLLNTFYVVFN